MEDNSSASSDSDNALLTQGRHTAATQTPEMARHSIQVPQNDTSGIVVYKLDTQRPMSELEREARNLAIPDVVVEYIKDSYRADGSDQGTVNPAFESGELIVVRTPSTLSLREGGDSIPLDSLQRNGKETLLGNNLQANVLTASTASLRSLIPPSPNFGYRPLESETSAIYTIIAPVKYNEKEAEARLLAQLQEKLAQEKAMARKFEFHPDPPADTERRMHRLQTCTDVCSMCFLVPGIMIAVFTPLMLIPMFLMPLKVFIPLALCFLVLGIISVIILAMSGFLGNIVWHYDGRKLRPRLHCGRGPLLHFWGNGFYKQNTLSTPTVVIEKV